MRNNTSILEKSVKENFIDMKNTILLKLAFRNIFRNTRRTIITCIAVLISVSSIIFLESYFGGIMGDIVVDTIKLTGHVKLQHPEYKLKERMLSLSVPVENYGDIIELLKKKKEIKLATGRIKFGSIININDENETGLGMGIIPDNEREILNLQNSLIKGQYFTGKDDETIVGREIVNSLNLDIGDTITVIVSTAYNSLNAANLRIVGICDLLNYNMNRIFYMPLIKAQDLLDMFDRVTEILIFTDDYKKTDELINIIKTIPEISKNYDVLDWLEAGYLETYYPLVQVMMIVFEVIFLLLAVLVIVNTILMAVFERTWEIGIINAVGMKGRQIMLLLLFEALMIGIIGGIVGILVGSGFGYLLEVKGITVGKAVEGFPIPIRQVIYGDLKWFMVIKSFIIGLFASVLAAFLPALKASRMEPAEALRVQ